VRVTSKCAFMRTEQVVCAKKQLSHTDSYYLFNKKRRPLALFASLTNSAAHSWATAGAVLVAGRAFMRAPPPAAIPAAVACLSFAADRAEGGAPLSTRHTLRYACAEAPYIARPAYLCRWS